MSPSTSSRPKTRNLFELGLIAAIAACLAIALAPPRTPEALELTPEQLRARQLMERATATGSKLARIAPAAAGVVVSAAAGDPFAMLKTMAPIEIEQLNDRLAADPQNIQLRQERARLHSLAGNPQAAIADIDWIINVQGDTADLRLRRADLSIRLGRYQQALQDNQTAASMDGTFPNTLHQRAEIAIGLGDFSQAISIYQKLGASEDDFKVAWGLAAAHRGLGDEQTAQGYFQQARNAAPRYCKHWQTSFDPGHHEGPHNPWSDWEF